MRRVHVMMGLVLTGLLVAGCSTAPKSPAARQRLMERAGEAREVFLLRDPSLSEVFDESHAWAIFPGIGRGGAGVGGAYGRGVVYENGQVSGFCDVSQGDIGFQLGGQSYRQLMFFRDEAALDRFKSGRMELSARASAVAATAGASADADYEHGVMIFTMARGGLMYEAAVGGQRFTYTPR